MNNTDLFRRGPGINEYAEKLEVTHQL
jgi:hypothetical protein